MIIGYVANINIPGSLVPLAVPSFFSELYPLSHNPYKNIMPNSLR